MKNVVITLTLALFFWAPAAFSQETATEGFSQQQAEHAAAEYLASSLKDPESATYVWEPIESGWWREGLLMGGKKYEGIVLKGKVNAKNSYGGYVGQTPWVFVFNQGEIIAVFTELGGRRGAKTMTKVGP